MKSLQRAIEAAERDPDGGKVLLDLDTAKALLAQTNRPTSADTKALEAAARAATPGPWVHEKSGEWDMIRSEALGPDGDGFMVADLFHGGYVYEDQGYTPEKVAAFIALANPQTILSLLSRIAELEEGVRTIADPASPFDTTGEPIHVRVAKDLTRRTDLAASLLSEKKE